jgi:hypothetical protein
MYISDAWDRPSDWMHAAPTDCEPIKTRHSTELRSQCMGLWRCTPVDGSVQEGPPFLSGQLIRLCVAQLVKVPAWDMSFSGSRKEAFPDVCAQYEAEKSERSKLPASARPLLPDSRFCEPLQTIRRYPQINTHIHASINR